MSSTDGSTHYAALPTIRFLRKPCSWWRLFSDTSILVLANVCGSNPMEHIPVFFWYFVLWPNNAQLFRKLSHCYMFRHYRVILRQPVINTLPSYTSISIPVPCIFYCFALWPTNAQLFHKLSHCYMFRHYRVILRQPVTLTQSTAEHCNIQTHSLTQSITEQLHCINHTLMYFNGLF